MFVYGGEILLNISSASHHFSFIKVSVSQVSSEPFVKYTKVPFGGLCMWEPISHASSPQSQLIKKLAGTQSTRIYTGQQSLAGRSSIVR